MSETRQILEVAHGGLSRISGEISMILERGKVSPQRMEQWVEALHTIANAIVPINRENVFWRVEGTDRSSNRTVSTGVEASNIYQAFA